MPPPAWLFSRESALSAAAQRSRWFVHFFRTEWDPNHRPWREEKAVFVGGLLCWKTITGLSPPHRPQRLASKSLIPKRGLCEENKGALSGALGRSGVPAISCCPAFCLAVRCWGRGGAGHTCAGEDMQAPLSPACRAASAGCIQGRWLWYQAHLSASACRSVGIMVVFPAPSPRVRVCREPSSILGPGCTDEGPSGTVGQTGEAFRTPCPGGIPTGADGPGQAPGRGGPHTPLWGQHGPSASPLASADASSSRAPADTARWFLLLLLSLTLREGAGGRGRPGTCQVAQPACALALAAWAGV